VREGLFAKREAKQCEIRFIPAFAGTGLPLRQAGVRTTNKAGLSERQSQEEAG